MDSRVFLFFFIYFFIDSLLLSNLCYFYSWIFYWLFATFDSLLLFIGSLDTIFLFIFIMLWLRTPSYWKCTVPTACESFQSGIQTWRMEGGLLWTSFLAYLLCNTSFMRVTSRSFFVYPCLRSTDSGGGIGYTPSLNSKSNFLQEKIIYFIFI